jgi:hypothetical protein
MFVWSKDGAQFPLCLDCYLRVKQAGIEEMKLAQRQLALLLHRADALVGFEPPPVTMLDAPTVNFGGVTLNNIRVSGSNVGVVNTGTIGTIDNAVGSLHNAGDNEAAAVITRLTESVLAADDLDTGTKDRALEVLSALASEATVPRENRRKVVGTSLFTTFKQLVDGANSVAQLVATAGPIIQGMFS